MEISGEYDIPAAREKVWAGLNDVEILRGSIPGCESIEQVSNTEFKAEVVVPVGLIKAKFRGKVSLCDLDPPNGYTITGKGTGAAGFAKGQAKVQLNDGGAGTRLAYQVTADVGGSLAQMGAGLVESLVNRLADEFFATFSALVSGEKGMPQAALEGAKTSGGKNMIFIWILAGLAAAVVYLVAGQ